MSTNFGIDALVAFAELVRVILKKLFTKIDDISISDECKKILLDLPGSLTELIDGKDTELIDGKDCDKLELIGINLSLALNLFFQQDTSVLGDIIRTAAFMKELIIVRHSVGAFVSAYKRRNIENKTQHLSNKKELITKTLITIERAQYSIIDSIIDSMVESTTDSMR